MDPIGISCRICERARSPQRAAPPLKSKLTVDHQRRRTAHPSMNHLASPENAVPQGGKTNRTLPSLTVQITSPAKALAIESSGRFSGSGRVDLDVRDRRKAAVWRR
nr:short-chain fatty acyl-CoA regulator family protein [Mesorhizobium sp. M1D.F.Ca.ET.043.01.1.1]